MCGIGGCIARKGGLPPEDRLQAMLAALAHRGPDGCGVVIEENVGLVHTRLSIVDPTPRGAQPMRHSSGQWVLTYNGEIFNHVELRNELLDADFGGAGDTETVLQAFAAWGTAAVQRFTGQFALAALDLDRRRLILARDRFGIKPLYIANLGHTVWFASEVGALGAAGVPLRANPETLSQALDLSFANGTSTVIEGIESIEPGTVKSISLDETAGETKTWFAAPALVDPERQAQLGADTRTTLKDRLRTTLREAVHSSLMADVPVGALCSGGLDSSLVAAYACEIEPEITAFAASNTEPGIIAEGPAARRLCDALGIDLDLTEVTPANWRAGFVNATWHFGAPIANASAVTIAQLAARARTRGVKVLLSGEGADELFGGYGVKHRDALRAFLSLRRRIGHRLEPARLRSPLGALAAALRHVLPGNQDEAPPPVALSQDRSAESGALSDGLNAYAHHNGARRQLEAEFLADLPITLPQLLNRMDKNAMQESVEVRIPFLEPSVVELALNLPLEARVGPRVKGLLRDLARELLPRKLAYRPKVYGMLFQGDGWIEAAADPVFLRDGALRELLAIRSDKWDEIIGSATGSRTVRLWSAEVFCRCMIDGATRDSVERDLWVAGP